MVVALLATLASALDCPDRLTREELAAQLDAAESAWVDLDAPGFRDRANELAGLLLPCMGDLVPPDLAARTHRVLALQRYELGNRDAAAGSVAAAKAADPTIAFPETWLPADHALVLAWQAADEPAYGKVPEPRVGNLAFDGVAGRERPRDLPTIAQQFDAAGVARATRYLGPREAFDGYDAIPRTRNALVATSAGAGLGGAALLVGSWLQYRSLLANAADPLTPADDLQGQRATSNLLFALGGGLVGVSVGLGAGALAVGER